jgi:uncharacterized protein
VRILALPFLCLFLSAPVWAWESNLQLPSAAPVVDEFGLLSENERASLSQLLVNAKATSGVEIGVYIPASMRGREIEDFSIAVAEAWQLGRKKEDKGLLLVVAPKERKMRLEVGYGLEGDLTDAYSGRLLDQVMRPFFREGRYFEGIVATLYGIQEKLPLGLDQAAAPRVSQGREVRLNGWVTLLLIGLFVLMIPIMIFIRILQALGIVRPSVYRHYGGGHWGGGGGWSSRGGGGFGSWGGGGGGFGGGGASSSW